jgi:hypothetical protein
MDAKPAPRAWYAGLDERLMKLGKEDPEVYKHWHDWYEPKAERLMWLKPNSPESLEKLMEALDTAIKRKEMDPRADKGRTPKNTWATCVVRRDGIRHCGTGESDGDALLDAYLSALKGCRGDEICPWLP